MGPENPISRKEGEESKTRGGERKGGREGGSTYCGIDGVSPKISAFPEGDELVGVGLGLLRTRGYETWRERGRERERERKREREKMREI